MMELKILSSFFQSSELTTLINVSWPAIVFMTIPFQFPISDTKCLASASNWTQTHTFYMYIYGPLLAFGARFVNPGFAERKKITSMMILVLSLWYSPMLQMLGSMYLCFQDTKGEGDPDRLNKWFLISDPKVSCEPSLERNILHFHTIVLSLFVGIGFPVISFWKIRKLRKTGKLDFDSSFANLFQFYNTRVPYFESVQFLRRGILIFALIIVRIRNFDWSHMLGGLTDWSGSNPFHSTDPTIHALINLAINGLYLLILLYSQPFVYFPSSRSKRNLFQVAEVSSTLTCLIGNGLGLTGSFFSSDQRTIDLELGKYTKGWL